MRRPAAASFTSRPANSRMVVVPTIQAPMPKLLAVLSYRLAALLRPGSRGQQSVRILPSMVVHMWQTTQGFIASMPAAAARAARRP